MAQVLESDDEIRAAALEVMGKQGFDLLALARSALLLHDKQESRRILAINLMSSLRPEDGETILDALLVDDNEPVEVYRHSVAALRRIGSEPALQILKRHADHPQEMVRESVQKALAQ